MNAKRLPFKIELVDKIPYPANTVKPFDINGDRVDELLIFTSYHMGLISQEGQYLWDFYYPPPLGDKRLSASEILDLEKDGKGEIFLSFKDPDKFSQTIVLFRPTFDGVGKYTVFNLNYGEDWNKDGKWDGGIVPIGLIDADDDGSQELILGLISGLDLQPRGIAVYDLKEKRDLWHFWIGPHLGKILVEDINNDGNDEIAVSTYAPGNGSKANGMGDWESFVFVLDRKGFLIWKKQIGRVFTGAKIAISDLDSDGKKELIVALFSLSAREQEPGKLSIFDLETGKERYTWSGGNVYGLVCVDLDHDGEDDIITGNSDGTIRVFDSNLNIKLATQFDRGVNLLDINDLDGDGKWEIIAVTSDERMIILNERLKELAEYKEVKHIFTEGIDHPENLLKTVQRGSKKRLLITLPEKGDVVNYLYAFTPIGITYFLGTSKILFIILITIVIFLAYLYLRKISLPAVGILNETKEGYIFLNKKGKVLFANRATEEILGVKELVGSILKERLPAEMAEVSEKEEGRITINTSEGEGILRFKRSRVKQGFLLRIEDVTKEEHLKRIESWAPVAQKLAHGIKNPLSTILGAVEQMEIKCEDKGVRKYMGYVKDEVSKLKKMSDAFMRFTKLSPPLLKPKNINEIIKKIIIGKYDALLEGKEGREIKVKYELNEKLPLLNLDEGEIANALNIIIENAIEAMPKGGVLRIRTLPAERLEKEGLKEFVRIEISDTGNGIPEKYLEKVFEPYFTYNKPLGTGLGLSLAKKIIEDHKGYIEIHSKEGVGTEANVYLPIKQ